MKCSEYVITGQVKNLGRVDGTTRDTWIATVRLAHLVGADAVERSGWPAEPGDAVRLEGHWDAGVSVRSHP